ncbi:PilZ domain-containing protein [Curvivirga aplysinae]|uniref:PilZ domain-containing protein n=1 Tax=Curvivirga aplysinae TaxID=2529852 RepID=UPI0012BC0292|nr:PilZ domain-containing protein [Curvivirga aplysinae]MTI09045.1 PilZ domain-containing protein [Curvivirga aplysinae]
MAEISAARSDFPRREMPRHMSSIPASFQVYGETFVGTIVNLSISGAMIMGCYSLAPNSRIMLNMPEIGRIDASVMWNNGEALGLTFENESTRQQDVESALSQTVNGLPAQTDRRNQNQYAQPASIH